MTVAQQMAAGINKNTAAQKLGKLGGKATLEKHGKDHFKKITKGWPKGKKRKSDTMEK